MSENNPNNQTLTTRLWRTHISTTSSAEDLKDTEEAHKEALAAAQAEHQRVREVALRAYSNNALKIERELLREKELQELERLKLETERAELQSKVLALQKQQILKPVQPEPSSLPPPRATAPKQSDSPQSQLANGQAYSGLHQGPSGHPAPHQSSPLRHVLSPQASPRPTEPTASQIQSHKHPSIPTRQADTVPPSSAPNESSVIPIPISVSTHESTSSHALPGAEKYLQIHKSLKQLRASITNYAKQDAEFKKKMGEMRREIRKSVGQLTEGRGANKTPMKRIVDTLKEALTTSSPPVNPATFLLSTPAPLQTAHNNGDTLPVLFIWLLNIFSKALISQFIDEAGVLPKAADPIGVIAVSVFAQAELCWRGASLIDILICKMRAVCPVLFGIRGSEKTEEGRARIGWRRGEGGDWVSDHVHNTRMTGLGAGYAAISLRDFSKSSNKNPYPPTNYWQSIAVIVNTPPEEASSTQYMVLKAMKIENYEQRFMNFYGTAARAALQVALVDFPERAKENTVAVSSLKVLGDKLKRDVGLRLKLP